MYSHNHFRGIRAGSKMEGVLNYMDPSLEYTSRTLAVQLGLEIHVASGHLTHLRMKSWIVSRRDPNGRNGSLLYRRLETRAITPHPPSRKRKVLKPAVPNAAISAAVKAVVSKATPMDEVKERLKGARLSLWALGEAVKALEAEHKGFEVVKKAAARLLA